MARSFRVKAKLKGAERTNGTLKKCQVPQVEESKCHFDRRPSRNLEFASLRSLNVIAAIYDALLMFCSGAATLHLSTTFQRN